MSNHLWAFLAKGKLNFVLKQERLSTGYWYVNPFYSILVSTLAYFGMFQLFWPIFGLFRPEKEFPYGMILELLLLTWIFGLSSGVSSTWVVVFPWYERVFYCCKFWLWLLLSTLKQRERVSEMVSLALESKRNKPTFWWNYWLGDARLCPIMTEFLDIIFD